MVRTKWYSDKMVRIKLSINRSIPLPLTWFFSSIPQQSGLQQCTVSEHRAVTIYINYTLFFSINIMPVCSSLKSLQSLNNCIITILLMSHFHLHLLLWRSVSMSNDGHDTSQLHPSTKSNRTATYSYSFNQQKKLPTINSTHSYTQNIFIIS